MAKVNVRHWIEPPDGFEPSSAAIAGSRLFVAGDSRWFWAELAAERVEFEELPFPALDELDDAEPEDVSLELVAVDYSSTTPRVVVNLGEFQGGSWGAVAFDGVDFDYIPSATDADIPWAYHCALRGDEFIAWGGYELMHYRRSTKGFEPQLIGLPTFDESFEASSLALSHDANTLVLSTDGATTQTAVFERVDGRFRLQRTIEGSFTDLRMYQARSVARDARAKKLLIWERPVPLGHPDREIELRDWGWLSGNRDFTVFANRDVLTVYDHGTGEPIEAFELPAGIGRNMGNSSDLASGSRVAMAIYGRVIVVGGDSDSASEAPHVGSPGASREGTYEEAKGVFAQFHGRRAAKNASQLVSLLEELPTGRENAGAWLWRGLRERRIKPSLGLGHTLGKARDAFEADDVIGYLQGIDQQDRNAWASTVHLVRATLPGAEALFVQFWRRSRGVLRAELGTYLAAQGLLSKSDLPEDSLEKEAGRLVRTPLSRPPDVTFPRNLERARKLWSDRALAQAMLAHVAGSQPPVVPVGTELQQWCAFVWPWASADQRAELIVRTSRAENVFFFADFVADNGLEPPTREALEAHTERVVVLEPGPNPPFDRTIWGYTYLTAAVVLGIDAQSRSAGLSPVGGKAFSRALEWADAHPGTCGITPELERLVSAVFGI